MELREALRTTGAVREFTDAPIERATISAILDDARFAPSGGNRQSWHVIVVEDRERRRRVRDAYLDAWHDYVAHSLAGLVPFSPLADQRDRDLASAQRSAAEAASRPEGFAERLDEVPVMLVVTADLSVLAAVDRDLDRYTMAGGASVYPFVWQIVLAARDRGLGGVMTTMAIRNEPDVAFALGVPDGHAVAAVVALGHPMSRLTRLRRRAVSEFATIDSFDGAPLLAPTS
jgi:nitroreductase